MSLLAYSYEYRTVGKDYEYCTLFCSGWAGLGVVRASCLWFSVPGFFVQGFTSTVPLY